MLERRWDRCLWLGNRQRRSFEGTLGRHKLDGWDSGVRTPQKAETFLGTMINNGDGAWDSVGDGGI